jgi:hypothetical protein
MNSSTDRPACSMMLLGVALEIFAVEGDGDESFLSSAGLRAGSFCPKRRALAVQPPVPTANAAAFFNTWLRCLPPVRNAAALAAKIMRACRRSQPKEPARRPALL